MEQQATYRNVTLSVRTPRFAVLIDKGSLYWHAYIEGIIQAFSQTWGGEYFLIIPTDGKAIDDKFWEILEAYSPDKIGLYVPTLLDLEVADPAQYQKIKEDRKKAWALPSDDTFEETWNREVSLAKINKMEIDKGLLEELKGRLAPFSFQDHIISAYVRRGEPLGYPFTQVLDILDYAKNKPEKITVPRKLANKELHLLASSRAGILTQKFGDAIKQKGLEEGACPLRVNDKDYVFTLEKDVKEIASQRSMDIAMGRTSEEYSEADFIRYLPFRLSMLELAKYYRGDIHRDWEENLVVVIGNDVADYCLYYCLSRIHEGIYWLPDSFLKDANDKTNANEGRSTEEKEELTETESFARSMVSAYFSKIGYGNEQKRISLVSSSLSAEQLQERKLWMGNISWLKGIVFSDAMFADEAAPSNKVERSDGEVFLDCVAVTPLADLSVHCVWRVIETNNYANQQDIVFQGGRSISRLNTPKPKNFSYVDPAKHRWITSINIDRYRPPALPFLGQAIFESLPASYDTRVAVDGLAYMCPHIAYFAGEDIDVNIVRPKLRLVDETEIFAQYFQYSGYDIELSDKGSYLKDTLERFGSLPATAEFFRLKQHRDLFDQYLYKKSEGSGDVVYLTTERYAYLSFNAFSRKLGDSEKARVLLDELIAKDILRRGLIFQCSRCRRAAWYDIGEVSREFQCKRCDLVQLFSQQRWKLPLEEPRWYYRLVETVYLFYESHSYLTALALDKLRQQSKEGFHYVCESDIKNFPEQGKKNEIDILAISDGKLILGECKDCEPEPNDLKKYQSLLSQLKIKPDRFVLATTETTISDEVKNKLAKIGHGDVLLRNDLMED